MSRDVRAIPTELAGFTDMVRDIPWFLNLGKPHPRDHEVVRIRDWAEWHGPEQGYGDWFGRFPAVVREHLEAAHESEQLELNAVWRQIEQSVMEVAIPNVPEYRADEDAWYGPTICVWHAGYIAALIGRHVLLRRPLPDPIADQWVWLSDGHWPCDYAEEPNGYGDETLIYVAGSKLLVY